MARSLLADLRLAFSLGVLGLGLATGAVADVTLRHAMAAERNTVLLAEGQRICRRLETEGTRMAAEAPPESSTVDWWLISPQGQRIASSAGSRYLQSVPWDSVGETPDSFRTDPLHLYSAVVVHSSLGTLWVAMDSSAEIQVIGHFRRDFAILLLGLTGLAGLIGHLIARRGLRPLERIRHETALIEAKDLHRRLDATRFPEELASLVSALNAALSRLEHAFKRLEAFSSDLAHEMKTPMQNLRAELEGLVLRPRGVDSLPDTVGSLLDELGRLENMADQMLFLARQTGTGVPLMKAPISVRAVFQETADFFEAAAEEKGLQIRVDAAPGLLVEADPGLLHRVLINLVGNAIRHTPSGGIVSMEGARAMDGMEIIVADTGEGVPPDLLPRLGDRFLRVDAARGRATGGAGLGLAIVKGIMELHGGAFHAGSALGHGTAIRLFFPEESGE
ncbi:MAG: HAMP domain-containing protein [Acidobacteria bacterium]|nr:HAMP domain-containing protein [Acidobacteriota bacterium]